MTPNRLLRDSLLAMAVAALGGAAAGCSHDPAPAATTTAPTASAQAMTASGGESASATNDPAHPGNDLPTATPVVPAHQSGR